MYFYELHFYYYSNCGHHLATAVLGKRAGLQQLWRSSAAAGLGERAGFLSLRNAVYDVLSYEHGRRRDFRRLRRAEGHIARHTSFVRGGLFAIDCCYVGRTARRTSLRSTPEWRVSADRRIETAAMLATNWEPLRPLSETSSREDGSCRFRRRR